MSVDLLIYNGIINCVDSKNTVATWLCSKDGVIIDIGNDSSYNKYLNDAKESIDLNGKFVLPGFYDNHINLVLAGISNYGVNLSKVTCLEELFCTIKDRSSSIFPGETIIGTNFIESNIKEHRFPTRRELDVCAPNNPVMINSNSYNSSSTNSLMLRRLELPYNLHGIDKDENNTFSGLLTFKANAYARKKLFSEMDDNLRKIAVCKVIEMAIKSGITTLVTFEGGFISHESHAKFILNNRFSFPIDVKMFYQSSNLKQALEHKSNMAGGLFLDGTITGRTAAISQPYIDKQTYGILNYNQDEVNEYVFNAHKLNMQLTAHCVGDRAIKQLLNAYDYAQNCYYREDPRFRIEHCEVLDDDLLKKAKELNVILSMQPGYEYYWGNEGGLYDSCLGSLSKKTNPFKKIVESGLIIAGGTDYDITPFSPMLGIHMAVNHPKKENRISVKEAIKMFTINGAYAVFEENIKGSLEVGKICDFIILEYNPFEICPNEIKDINIIATIKEGIILYRSDLL